MYVVPTGDIGELAVMSVPLPLLHYETVME